MGKCAMEKFSKEHPTPKKPAQSFGETSKLMMAGGVPLVLLSLLCLLGGAQAGIPCLP
jgi:hypothetical protein